MSMCESLRKRVGALAAAMAVALGTCLGCAQPVAAHAAEGAQAQERITAATVETQAASTVYLSNAAVTVQPIPDETYNGLVHTPEPVLMYNGAVMKKGVDYIISSYSGNTNAGSASIWVKGIGSFSGGKSISFTIKQADINKATMTIADQEYTGYVIYPSIDASFDGTELQRYSDYRVTFKNNRYVGTAEALITGNGNFTGERTLTFKIKTAANKLAVVAKSKSIKVTDTARMARTVYASQAYRFSDYGKGERAYKKGAVKAKGAAAKKYAKKIKVNKKTGDITIAKGTPKGTYTVKVKVTAKGDEGHRSKTKTVTLKIKVK